MGAFLPYAAAASLNAGAAPARGRKRIVLVRFAPHENSPDMLDEVVMKLGRRGFAEGRELDVHRLLIDFRGVEQSGRFDHAVERIRLEGLPLAPDLFLTEGTGLTEAIQKITRKVPIVTSVADPVGSGFARSLARPGGNVTGLADGVGETAGKAIEVLRRLVPRLARLAVFHSAGPRVTRFAGHYERAARDAGISPEMFPATDLPSLVAAIRRATFRRAQAGFLLWSEDELAPGARAAIEVRLPMMGAQENAPDSGCLASYYAHDTERVERFATVVEKVLRGSDPAVIPFQYPLTFRLVLNRRTATALGIELPPDLLVRADRVIE